MTPADLAEHLKQVPPTHLQLISLAWELVGEEDAVDTDKVLFRIDEVTAARGEALAYIQGTTDMVEALKQCLKPDP